MGKDKRKSPEMPPSITCSVKVFPHPKINVHCPSVILYHPTLIYLSSSSSPSCVLQLKYAFQTNPIQLLNNTWNLPGTTTNMKPMEGIHIDQPTTNASGTSFCNLVITINNHTILYSPKQVGHSKWTLYKARETLYRGQFLASHEECQGNPNYINTVWLCM